MFKCFFLKDRTIRFGLKNLQVERGHLWVTLPNNIKGNPSRKAFVRRPS